MSQSDYHQAKYVLPTFRFLWARPSKLTSSLGVLKILNHADLTAGVTYAYTLQDTAANGDRMLTYLYAVGSETTLDITTHGDGACGVWDLYINGVLDSSGYDEYLAAPAIIHHNIVLSQPLKVGENEIQFRINGKNVASTNYYVQVFGVSLS